jgi:Fur family iron response transcriptional regulator
VSDQLRKLLKDHGVQPSFQRLAVAEYVLRTPEHPSAERVWAKVKKRHPGLSRATVYNTLNLFVEKGLLVQHVLSEGKLVFDPNLERHHHFIDDHTGRIYDVAWDRIQVKNVDRLPEFRTRDYQVVMRGRVTK